MRKGCGFIPYKTIKSYVSKLTYERAKAFCSENEITLAELIRLALIDYINKNERKEWI